jgi:quercetin dioxygenase-like cupin family protein
MKITRIYTGSDGESHFEDIEVKLNEVLPAAGVYFRIGAAGQVQDWHPAPRRQYVITLSGEAEIEISDGSKRRFGPGDAVLAEDTTGRGHITRVVGDRPRFYVSIPVD